MGVRRGRGEQDGRTARAELQRGRTRGSAERRSEHAPLVAHGVAPTGPHSWECGERLGVAAPSVSRTCFNGAALVGVRRVRNHDTHTAFGKVLQRGRTRGSAESRLGIRELASGWNRFNGAALVGVRRAASLYACLTDLACFNGAALVGVRRDLEELGRRVHKGSCFNGAALVGVRRDEARRGMLVPSHSLQRGRTRGSAESRGHPGCVPACVGASTGPHSWECGERALHQRITGLLPASTGPHSWECGEW